MLLAAGILFDLSISSFHIKNISYQQEMLWSLAGIVALLGILRAIRRWQGIKDMKSFKSFSLHIKSSKSSLQYAILHSALELMFMLFTIIIAAFILMPEPHNAYPILLVSLFLFIESSIFLLRRLKNDQVFGVGVNKDVIAYFNREMKLLYFTGLQRVTIHYGMIHFQYKGELSMFLPATAIADEDRVKFRDHLIETLSEKNVYIDEAFRQWH